jgi:hypothetical protein
MGFKDITGEWQSWYENEYRSLDFPKCPKPIYFEFSLQEVLFAIFEKCNISTGNMQRERTKFGQIEQMISLFNFQDLFIIPGKDKEEWRKFREYAQQEFMIQGELDFSSLKYCKVICANQEDRALLIKLLGIDSIDFLDNIVIDELYYQNKNPSIYHSVENDRIKLMSNKKAEGYFILFCKNISLLEIIEGDVLKQEKDKITFKSKIEFINLSKIDITIKYVDEIYQEWFILSNYALVKKDYDEIKFKTTYRKAF